MLRSFIRQGDTLTWLARPLHLADGDPIPASYICRAGLYQQDGTPQVEAFSVTNKTDFEGDEYFLVQLQRDATAPASPGKYDFRIRIYNDTLTPRYSDEELVVVSVAAGLVGAA